MPKRILFSPIGGTDPISETNLYDGALLHICRYRKPDQVKLFMSGEIYQYHLKDDRYLRALHLLEAMQNRSMEIEIIPKPELKDVHVFESMFCILKEELEKVQETIQVDDELILNMSSGTPAMKSALVVLATMLDIPCTCVQVANPERRMGEHSHTKGEFDLETLWELNPDNGNFPDIVPRDRTSDQWLPSLAKIKFETNIKNFVNKYDYDAAITLAKQLRKRGESTPYLVLLEIANYRSRLDFDQVDRLLPSVEEGKRKIYCPFYKDPKKRRIMEYSFEMQKRLNQKDYKGFILGISPLLTDLFRLLLLEQADLNIDAYTYEDRRGKLKWKDEALEGSEVLNVLNEAVGGNFRPHGFVQNWELRILINGFIGNNQLKKVVSDLMKVEDRLRDTAAHQMVAVTGEWLKERVNMSGPNIMNKIKEGFSYTEFDISDEWNTYEIMNEEIIKSI